MSINYLQIRNSLSGLAGKLVSPTTSNQQMHMLQYWVMEDIRTHSNTIL